MIKYLFFLSVMAIACVGCVNQESVSGPEPFLPIPNQAQLNWHKAEYIMFVHFGMKTFYPSSDHMGYGQEDPEKFNPVNFDAEQWVNAAKAGGFRGIVLTAKHHDGFCNWQTETTEHSVRSSLWKDGKGDIIKELIEACREGGVYFGIYVSILDKHFEFAGSEQYDNYGDYYYAQLRELSTNYGPIDEYWFDGYKADELAQMEKVVVKADSYRGSIHRFSPIMTIDDDYESYFATDDSVKNAVIEIDLGSVQEIKGFILQEYISLGQRVDGYSVECRVNGNWIEVFSGKKIGYKRIILEGRASASEIEFPASDGVRMKIKQALACPLISTFQVIGDSGILR